MRKKTDLSDIILEKEKTSNSKHKKVLISAASLVLLFLIFLIASKILNSTIDDDKTLNNNEEAQIKVTDTTDKEKTKEQEKKDESKNDTDSKFEAMVEKLRAEDAKKSADSSEIVQVVKPAKKTSKVTQKKDEKKTDAKKEEKPKSSIVISDASKKPAVKPTKTVHKPVIKRPVIPSFGSSKSGYYIQVGATTTPAPNKTLVRKIKANGFHYVTHPTVVKGRKFYKILIGPYSTRNGAGAVMDRVKATINPKAFFYHIR